MGCIGGQGETDNESKQLGHVKLFELEYSRVKEVGKELVRREPRETGRGKDNHGSKTPQETKKTSQTINKLSDRKCQCCKGDFPQCAAALGTVSLEIFQRQSFIKVTSILA